MKYSVSDLRLNKKIMFITRFFIEFKSINSVIQLFYLSRDLNLGHIIYLSLIWSVTTLICDVPSSFLADKFGRKRLIQLGILMTALSTLMLFWGSGFIYFALIYAISAAGYSFFTGADHALLYDSLKELGDEKSSNRVAGKYFSSQSLPKIVLPFLGGIIARDLLPWQFTILIGIDLIGVIMSFCASVFLTEPRVENLNIKRLELIKQGFKLIHSDKILIKLALNKIIIFQATFVYWRIYQVFLKSAGMSTFYLGLIYTIFQGVLFLMFWNTERVQKYLGKITFANLPPILGIIALSASLLTANLVILFIACIALFIVGTIRDPLFLSAMQSRIPSFNRATATSTLNTIKNITDIPLLILVGLMANINIDYVLLISGLLFLVPVLFLNINAHDLKSD